MGGRGTRGKQGTSIKRDDAGIAIGVSLVPLLRRRSLLIAGDAKRGAFPVFPSERKRKRERASLVSSANVSATRRHRPTTKNNIRYAA